MGFGGVSFWQLLIVFAIVILIFGTSRLKNLGGDLGGAIRGFRKAVEHDEAGDDSGGDSHVDSRGDSGRARS